MTFMSISTFVSITSPLYEMPALLIRISILPCTIIAFDTSSFKLLISVKSNGKTIGGLVGTVWKKR